jgi:anti-sigma regulatory factor (Ser/Thr protein kinase)
LRLVLEEAILNGWVHGNRRDPEKALTVRVRWGNDMHLEILDQGEGFDCGNVPDPTTEANLTKLTGRGIFIIRHYASSAVWEGNGRRLVASFKKRLNPVEEDAAVRAGRLMRLWGQVPAQD